MSDVDMVTRSAPLLHRVAQAVAEIGSLEKDRTNLHQGYDYLSENAVKKATREVMVKYNLMPKDVQVEVLSLEWRQGKQAEMRHAIVKVTLIWEDSSSAQGLGEGQDYGDKAIMKAQTVAYREALKMRFAIATGQDSESDPVGDEPTRRRPEVRPEPDNTPSSRKAAQAFEATREPPSQADRWADKNRAPHAPRQVPTVPYGDDRGLPIDDPRVTERSLLFLLRRAQENLSSDDPRKQKYRRSDEAFARALEVELDRRQQDNGPADEGGYPIDREDGIPF